MLSVDTVKLASLTAKNKTMITLVSLQIIKLVKKREAYKTFFLLFSSLNLKLVTKFVSQSDGHFACLKTVFALIAVISTGSRHILCNVTVDQSGRLLSPARHQ